MLVEMKDLQAFLKEKIIALVDEGSFDAAKVVSVLSKEIETHPWVTHKTHPFIGTPTGSALPLFTDQQTKELPHPDNHFDSVAEALRNKRVSADSVTSLINSFIEAKEIGDMITRKELCDHIEEKYPELLGIKIGKTNIGCIYSIVDNFLKLAIKVPKKNIKLTRTGRNWQMQRSA